MNINIALDSNYFKPYTFLDIIAPAALFKQDWEADLERYLAIAELLGNLEAAVLNTKIAKGLYDAYNTEFQSAVDEFNTGRLNKTRLSKLRNRYNTEMKKVLNANELYSKEATRRMNLLDKDPTMIFSDIGTLDDYITNPNRMTLSYSKENLRTLVARTMQAIGKGFANMGITGHLDKYNYQLMEQNGFTPEEINNFIQLYQSGDSSVLNTIYGQAVRNIIDSTGIGKWANESDYNDAINYALDGAYQGIGEMKLSHMRDEGAYAAMQHYYHELQADNAARRAAAKNNTINGNGVPTSTTPVHFTDRNIASKSMKANLAQATLDIIKNNLDRPLMEEYYNELTSKYKDDDGILKYFQEKGIDGRDLKRYPGNYVYNTLKNGLINLLGDNINKDALVDSWLSDYMESPTGSAGGGVYNKKTEYSKVWGKFNDDAASSFRMLLTDINMKPNDLTDYLKREMPKLRSGKNSGIYKVDNFGSDGTANYTSQYNNDQIPYTNGEVNYSKISTLGRAKNGVIVTWTDTNGNSQYGIIPDENRSLEYQRDRQLQQVGADYARALYESGAITEDEYLELLRDNINLDLLRQAGNTLNVNVQDFTIK